MTTKIFGSSAFFHLKVEQNLVVTVATVSKDPTEKTAKLWIFDALSDETFSDPSNSDKRFSHENPAVFKIEASQLGKFKKDTIAKNIDAYLIRLQLLIDDTKRIVASFEVHDNQGSTEISEAFNLERMDYDEELEPPVKTESDPSSGPLQPHSAGSPGPPPIIW
ncbi:MAG: hypothetical protein ACFB9M_09970 [Myxococcota bacterium]